MQNLALSRGGVKLLSIVLEDLNTEAYRTRYLSERSALLKQLEEQDSFISKARKLFVSDHLKFDDFSRLKEEYRNATGILKKEINTVMIKLNCLDQYIRQARKSLENVFSGYQYMDVSDKKKIISLIPPGKVDIQTRTISLRLNSSLTKILRPNIHSPNDELHYTNSNDCFAYHNHHFTDKKVTTQKTIELLGKNNIQVSDEDAAVILDFLYHVAQCYNKQDSLKP